MLERFFGIDIDAKDLSYWQVIKNSTFQYSSIMYQCPEDKDGELYRRFGRRHFSEFPKESFKNYTNKELIYIERNLSLPWGFWGWMAVVNVGMMVGIPYLAWRFGPRAVKFFRIKDFTKWNLVKYG